MYNYANILPQRSRGGIGVSVSETGSELGEGWLRQDGVLSCYIRIRLAKSCHLYSIRIILLKILVINSLVLGLQG